MIAWLARMKDAIAAGRRSAVRSWRWPASLQVERALVSMQTDLRWLSVSPDLEELCERHLKLMQPNWMELGREDISDFRKRIGHDPHEKRAGQKTAPGLPSSRLPLFVRSDEEFMHVRDACARIEAQNEQALSADCFYVYAMPALAYAAHRIAYLKNQRDEMLL